MCTQRSPDVKALRLGTRSIIRTTLRPLEEGSSDHARPEEKYASHSLKSPLLLRNPELGLAFSLKLRAYMSGVIPPMSSQLRAKGYACAETPFLDPSGVPLHTLWAKNILSGKYAKPRAPRHALQCPAPSHFAMRLRWFAGSARAILAEANHTFAFVQTSPCNWHQILQLKKAPSGCIIQNAATVKRTPV